MADATATRVLDRLLELSVLLTRDMEAEFGRQGLTLARTHLIWELHQRGPLKQRELAGVLEVSPRNVSALVDALVGSEHVTRAPHPADRRAFLVTLTRRGGAVASQMAEGRAQLATHLFADLPAADRASANRVLEQAVHRLQSMTGGPEAEPSDP